MRTWTGLVAAALMSLGGVTTGGAAGAVPVSVARASTPSFSADDVVAAGGSAYLVDSKHDSLWYVDPNGVVSARTAPAGLGRHDDVLQLAFADAGTGLAITGTSGGAHHDRQTEVWATTDGARSWRPVALPTMEQPLQVVLAGGSAYALTTDCVAASSPCRHATVWSVDPTDAVAPHSYDSLPTRTRTDGPVTMTAYGESVWVLLDMGAGRSTPLRSTDGGQTWTRFRTDQCLAEPMVATSTKVVWSTCVTGMEEHFVRERGNQRPAGVFDQDQSGTSNSQLLPLTDNLAHAVLTNARRTHLAITTNGGHTTRAVATLPSRFARHVSVLRFVSKQVGYLVTPTNGHVYRTSDGGRSWRRL